MDPFKDKKECAWLTKVSSMKKDEICVSPKIQDHCIKTCNECRPPTGQNCEDKAGEIKIGSKKRTCSYLVNITMSTFKTRKCKQARVRKYCYKACTNCISQTKI